MGPVEAAIRLLHTLVLGDGKRIRRYTRYTWKEEIGMADTAEPKCTFGRDPSGIPICRKHSQPPIQNSVTSAPGSNPPGLGHLSAWVCPVSQENVFDASFPC